ncbi:pantothenate transporter [Truncatella angustata]|uniref:Pantothenate transporter n=1 Tax=Truncatella angustata TaxID=152316 RepID=A0A9P8RKV7_9PEZI|nr:pantothenate transporter [Truncatella angustata]KAH6645150.1 pantothenate transporter [Truncatella angustata]
MPSPRDENEPLLGHRDVDTTKPNMSAFSHVKSVLWGPASKERSVVIKLDFTILPYFSLIWFLFGVNRASYSHAYISGMKEDLGFQGTDYNLMSTIYLVFYAVFQIPSTSLLTLARPKYVFVAANVTWSVLTLITFRMQHVYQLFILNGFEGAFSAIAYVGAHFIYGSWYKKSELSTRAAIFCCFGHLGSIAGGWIQAGLITSLDGKGGLPAWRWVFVIVSVITIPVAALGWVVIPNLPIHKSAWYLSDEEKDLAVTRLGKFKKASWDLTVFRRVLLSWQFWLLPLIFMLYSLCVQSLGNNVMPLWMASKGYTVIQQNTYPTAIYATAILGTVIYSIISDKIQSRWQPSLAIGLTFIIGSAILVADPVADGAHFFAFYLLGTTYAPQAVWYSWMADVTAHDIQLRAITTGFMNSFDFAFVTWWPLIFYPVTDAPNYEKGYIASLVTGALVIPFIGLIAYLEKRDRAAGKIGMSYDDEDDETDDLAREDINSQAADAGVAPNAKIVPTVKATDFQ